MKKSIEDVCDEIIKSKYTRRTGSKGNYKYYYTDPYNQLKPEIEEAPPRKAPPRKAHDLGARHTHLAEKIKNKRGPRAQKVSPTDLRESKYGSFAENKKAKEMGFRSEGSSSHGARFEKQYDKERKHIIEKIKEEQGGRNWAFTVESSIGKVRLATYDTLAEALHDHEVNYLK